MSSSPSHTGSGNENEETQQNNSHPETDSHEVEPPSYNQVEQDSSRQEETDTQDPRQLGYQSGESLDSIPDPEAPTMAEEAATEGPHAYDLPVQRNRNAQLPNEHAQQPSSPSNASTLQRAVVVEGRIVWTEAAEEDQDGRRRSGTLTRNALSSVQQEIDHEKPYPDKQTEVISEIITALYDEAQTSDPNDPYETPHCETCTDTVCQKINCTNLFKTKQGKKLLLSDTLRRGREKGWKMLVKIIFPLLPDAARDVWVVGEIFTALLGLLLSITAVVLRSSEPFGIVHLAFIILFSILAIIDGVFTLKDCTTCRKCHNIYKGDYRSHTEHDPYFKCCSKTFTAWSKNVLDVTRVSSTEIMLYPLVICDIFKVITGRRFEEGGPHADRLAVVLLVLTTISFIFYVYIARLLILVRMMKKVLAIRSPNYKLITNYYELHQNHYDFSVRKSAFWYQFYLLVHTILQMITQLLIFVAIGAKMYNDNQNLYIDDITDRSVHFSAYLWYLIVVGFITPIFGFLTSILVTYYWTQEFPIGLCLDIVGIWKMGGAEDFVHVKDQLGDPQGSSISKKIDRFLKVDKLRAEFQQLRQTNWCKKLMYPYTVPAVAIPCMIYLVLQAAMVIYAATAIGEMGIQKEQLIDEGGWVYFYIVAVVIFAAIANTFSISVASFWILVVLSSFVTLLSHAIPLSFSAVVILAAIIHKYCCMKK